MNKQEKELAIQELEKAQEALAAQMAELKAAKVEPEKYKRYRAKAGGFYFYVDNRGKVLMAVERSDDLDKYRWLTGNYKETEEEAQAALNKQLAKQRIIDRIAEENHKEGWVCDFGDISQSKHYAYFNHYTKTLEYGVIKMIQNSEVELCSGSAEVFRSLEADYKIMWGIE